MRTEEPAVRISRGESVCAPTRTSAAKFGNRMTPRKPPTTQRNALAAYRGYRSDPHSIGATVQITNLTSLMNRTSKEVLAYLAGGIAGSMRLNLDLVNSIQQLARVRPFVDSYEIRTSIIFWDSLADMYSPFSEQSPEKALNLLDTWRAWILCIAQPNEPDYSGLTLRWLEEFARLDIDLQQKWQGPSFFAVERVRDAFRLFFAFHRKRHPEARTIPDLRKEVLNSQNLLSPEKRKRRDTLQPLHIPVIKDSATMINAPSGIPLRGNIEDYWPMPKEH